MAKMLLVPPDHIVREAEKICYARSAKACMPDADLDAEWPEDEWVTLSNGYHLELYVVDDGAVEPDTAPQGATWRGTIFHSQTGCTLNSPQYGVFDHHVVDKEIETA